jgi:hypothetical protein
LPHSLEKAPRGRELRSLSEEMGQPKHHKQPHDSVVPRLWEV